MRKKKEPQNMGIPNRVFVKIKTAPKTERGKKSIISYNFYSSPFGKIVVASTPQGVCYTGFYYSRDQAIAELRSRFPDEILWRQKNKQHDHVRKLFAGKWERGEKLLLCLKGTDFQLKVWNALLKIPAGKLSTYSKIAKTINHANAHRAVGTAIGKNPILYLIPCHRVIAKDGKMGGFYWGIEKKMELLDVENAGYLHFNS
jgi:AraC family transcriptional regulator of adaptative response/methylated-DNA-[protein]-cysteine methyltransferase